MLASHEDTLLEIERLQIVEEEQGGALRAIASRARAGLVEGADPHAALRDVVGLTGLSEVLDADVAAAGADGEAGDGKKKATVW